MSSSASQVPVPAGFLTDALTRDATHADVAAYREAFAGRDQPDIDADLRRAVATTFGRGGVALLMVVPGVAYAVLFVLYAPVGIGAVVVLIIVCAGSALLIATIGRRQVQVIRTTWHGRAGWTHRWRLASFALDNGLRYSAKRQDLRPLGSVLHHISPRYRDTFELTIDGREAILANVYSADTSSQSHARDGWSVLAILLDSPLPHLYLAPRTPLAATLSPLITVGLDQHLKLEGDFDRHFTLYAPRSYERDALYVITPDLMALLIDDLPGAHVEVVERLLTITRPAPFDFTDPATWDVVARLTETVVRKTARVSSRYRDDRAEVPGAIGTAGRRLRAGIPLASIVFALLAVWNIYYLFSRL